MNNMKDKTGWIKHGTIGHGVVLVEWKTKKMEVSISQSVEETGHHKL